MDEINPFVSNIIMFKSCVFIVEYVCSITGAVIFTFYQGKYFCDLLHF
ncbi:hypothetical protein T01_7374 [Trichinella spiralis]|uniref:Uncharacterized protein n=1 Tax=Trichinella spiralis TaxID=6334 RepID=A0A0V1A8B8_TRISP|nr:hypothetical protein T01_7374 [Trichinella spiralis]